MGRHMRVILHGLNLNAYKHNYYRSVDKKDEDNESRGSGFVVLYLMSQACKSCWEWNFGGDHA